MTREEAIDKLEWLWNEVYNEDSDGSDYAAAIDMAIEALSAERVVLCRDCMYRNWETNGCNANPCVEEWQEDDFCSRAKMKGDE